MSKPDAERALNIYKRFCKQTEQVNSFLQVAKNYEHAIRLEIKKVKHAPTKLVSKLEEYINDPEFEQNRRRFVVEKEAKKLGKKVNGAATSSRPFGDSQASTSQANNFTFPDPKPSSQTAPSKGPDIDLIDFFEPIEQVTMAQQPSQPFQQLASMPGQATGFAQVYSFPQQNAGFQGFQSQTTGFQQQPFAAPNGQSTNPFAQAAQPQPQQIQTNFTSAGFGGYTAQPQQQPQQTGFQPSLSSIPQSGVTSFQPQTQQQPTFTSSPIVSSPASTNPFRQSMMPTGTTVSSASSIGYNPTGTTISSASTFPSSASRQSTNPFAKTATPPQIQPFSAPLSQPTQPITSLPFTPGNPFQSAPPQQPPQQQPQRVGTLIPAATGTNPFAKPQSSPFSSAPPPANPVLSNPTGSTNPFRQSQFVNQNTGQGWQAGPQGTIGGFNTEALGTTTVFPRPGFPQGQQQSGWQG